MRNWTHLLHNSIARATKRLAEWHNTRFSLKSEHLTYNHMSCLVWDQTYLWYTFHNSKNVDNNSKSSRIMCQTSWSKYMSNGKKKHFARSNINHICCYRFIASVARSNKKKTLFRVEMTLAIGNKIMKTVAWRHCLNTANHPTWYK